MKKLWCKNITTLICIS